MFLKLRLSDVFRMSAVTACLAVASVSTQNAGAQYYGGGGYGGGYGAGYGGYGSGSNGGNANPGGYVDNTLPSQTGTGIGTPGYGNGYGGYGRTDYSAGRYYGGGAAGAGFGGAGAYTHGHLPSAAANPATMPFEGGAASRQAEHERVKANMRKAGFSEDRINADERYMRSAPITGRKIGNGVVDIRDDGTTVSGTLDMLQHSNLTQPSYTNAQDANYRAYRANGGGMNRSDWNMNKTGH